MVLTPLAAVSLAPLGKLSLAPLGAVPADALPASLAYGLSFLHPILMWILLGLSGYALVLGIRAKKTRTASAEERKELIKGQFARRHFLFGSLVLAVMVLGMVGGMAVTWINNGKLFVGPHLLVGLGMTALVAVAAALAPLMQQVALLHQRRQGNLLARKAHVGLNMLLMTLFLWQAVSGMQIVAKIVGAA